MGSSKISWLIDSMVAIRVASIMLMQVQKVHYHAFFQKKRFASLAAVCRWISLDARGGDKGCESKTKQGDDLKAAVFRM
jgi:hypothetical protein